MPFCMYSYDKKEICETFSNNLPSSTRMRTLAKQSLINYLG